MTRKAYRVRRHDVLAAEGALYRGEPAALYLARRAARWTAAAALTALLATASVAAGLVLLLAANAAS